MAACLTSPWNGARGSKNCHVGNILMYRNRKVDSLYNRTQQKILISLRLHWKFNICDPGYENVMKCEVRKIGKLEVLLCTQTSNYQIIFNLGLNVAKNKHHMKKASNKSCSKLNFVQKSPRAHLSICRGSGPTGLERF